MKDKTKTYYYNNRPVHIIAKAGNNMYLICANVSGVNTSIKGEDFCSACQIGDSDNKLNHTCEEAEYIINDIFEAMTQEDEIFWVHEKTLKENYFEYKANEELQKSISDLEAKKQALKDDIKVLMIEKNNYEFVVLNSKTNFEKSKEEEIAAKNSLDSLLKLVEQERNKLADIKITNDLRISLSITTQEYRELLKAEIQFNNLINGGVDNWSYYGDCIQEDEEVEQEIDLIIKSKL